MKTSEEIIDYAGSKIVFQTIEFGQCLYIYLGSELKLFDDLTFAMPSRDSTHLIGNTPNEEIASIVSAMTKKPVIASYNFKLENDDDNYRFEYLKTFLRKRYAGK